MGKPRHSWKIRWNLECRFCGQIGTGQPNDPFLIIHHIVTHHPELAETFLSPYLEAEKNLEKLKFFQKQIRTRIQTLRQEEKEKIEATQEADHLQSLQKEFIQQWGLNWETAIKEWRPWKRGSEYSDQEIMHTPVFYRLQQGIRTPEPTQDLPSRATLIHIVRDILTEMWDASLSLAVKCG